MMRGRPWTIVLALRTILSRLETESRAENTSERRRSPRCPHSIIRRRGGRARV